MLQPNRYTDGDLAVIDSGVSDLSISCVVTPFNSGSNHTHPGIVFRYQDSSNYWYYEVNPNYQQFHLYEVNGGTQSLRTQYRTTVTSGLSITLRVDCKGNNIVLYVNGVEIVTYVSASFKSNTKVGVRIGKGGSVSGSNATYSAFMVKPFSGLYLNWPLFTESASNPLIALGSPGSYDSNDANDPNVVYDSANNRYVMYYSAFNGGASGQTTAIASATSLEGPWTKFSQNPVLSLGSLPYGEDGGLVYWNNYWWKSYESSSGHVGMAKSADLISWTNLGAVLPDNCPGMSISPDGSFLRITQDGSTMQCWFTTGNTVGYVTSTDGVNFTLGSNSAFLSKSTGVYTSGFYSPAVYVPPGKEGAQYLVMCDTFTYPSPTDRVITMNISLDGGATWHERYAGLDRGTGWMSEQVFDADPIVVGNKMYLFHSGANTAGGTVNLNAEIGVAIADFDSTSLLRT